MPTRDGVETCCRLILQAKFCGAARPSSKTGATLESKALIPNQLVRGMIRAFNETAGAAR